MTLLDRCFLWFNFFWIDMSHFSYTVHLSVDWAEFVIFLTDIHVRL